MTVLKRLLSSVLLLILVTVPVSCSSVKTIKTGTFTLSYPSGLNITEISVDVPESYQEYHYLQCLEDNAVYERQFRADDKCVFEVHAVVQSANNDNSLKEYASQRQASLIKNDGVWSKISVLEEKEDSIIVRAAPSREEVQDMGVRYFRFFRKDGNTALIEIIVREEADERYQDTVESILKKAK